MTAEKSVCAGRALKGALAGALAMGLVPAAAWATAVDVNADVAGAAASNSAPATQVSLADEADANYSPLAATNGYTYLYAAIPYGEYWAAEGVYAAGSTASSDAYDLHDEQDCGAFDAVSRATTNHGLHRGSYQCEVVVHTAGGDYYINSFANDNSAVTLVDGTTVTFGKGVIDGQAIESYEVLGVKYVPVRVATDDLAAFKEAYTCVENGGTLAGGYTEQLLSAYTATAAVDANTYGLKTATLKADGTWEFSARSTQGTGSGLAGQAELKTINLAACGPVLGSTDGSTAVSLGSYGDFIRVDFKENYGEIGAAMQAVTWTYYGEGDTVLATFGTKFAADNWMHKSNGLQLGLTESLRCQLPEGTDGTGRWELTITALGYKDATYSFELGAANVLTESADVTAETKAALEALVAKAAALSETDYTAASWKASGIALELAESQELLAKAALGEAECAEQVQHLQAAVDALVSAAANADALYADVTAGDWFASFASRAAELGLMSGYAGNFSPNDNLTRGQAITVLYRAVTGASATEPNGTETVFADVPAGEYYTAAVKWARDNNITTGTSATTFSPNAYITRQDLATLIWRAAGEPAATDNGAAFAKCKDTAAVASYAVDALKWTASVDVLSGSDAADGKYVLPVNNALRSQAAKMFTQAYAYLK
jgi:hypothetical protein